jgi:hypothetical protein
MWRVSQTRPHCVIQMGKTHSKPLAARHGRGTAWARHAMCESTLSRPSVYSYRQLIPLALTSILPGLESQTTKMPINAIFCTTVKCEQPWRSQRTAVTWPPLSLRTKRGSLLTNIYGFSFSFPVRSSISSPKRSDLSLFPWYSHLQNVVKVSQKMTISDFKMSR